MNRYWSLTRQGAVVILTLNKPPQNTLSFVALSELDDLLAEVSEDAAASVVVVTGAIPGYFIAHADLDDVGRMARREPPRGDPDIYRRAFARLESMPQPVIAAVNGQAWGGGCELALACSFRLLAKSAHFCQLEVAKGAIPGGGGTQRLPRLIGISRALRMILAAEVVPAEQALAFGLADAVMPDEEFLTHVLAWVRPIAEQPRHALLAAKSAVMQGLYLPFQDALDNEQRLFLQTVTGKEFVEEPR